MDIFLEYLKSHVRESTYITYESCYRKLKEMDLKNTDKIYGEIIRMKSTTQNNYIRTLNHWERYNKTGKIWKATKVREEDRRIKEEYLTLEDILKMIKGAKTIRIKAEIATMYGTGIRINELRTIKHQDLDPISKRIQGVKAKGNKRTNAYFIDTYFYEILKDYLTWKANSELYVDLCKNEDYIFCDGSGKPYSKQTIWNDIKRTARILKNKKSISPHTLRHSFVYSAMEQGIPQDAISKNIGHSSTLVTEKIYTHYYAGPATKKIFWAKIREQLKKTLYMPGVRIQ